MIRQVDNSRAPSAQSDAKQSTILIETHELFFPWPSCIASAISRRHTRNHTYFATMTLTMTMRTNFSDVSEGVDVIPNSTVEHVSFSDGRINLRLNTGNEVRKVLCFLFLLSNVSIRIFLNLYKMALGVKP